MQANDAMRILGSAAAMGLLGSGGALAYNAISKPTLDEYGNTIESNDINPFVAALGGAAIGAASNYGFNKWVKNRVHNNLDARARGMNAGVSSQPQQSPDIDIDIDVAETVKPPYPDFRNMSDDQFKEFYTTRHDYSGSTNDRKAIHNRMSDIVGKEVEKYEQTAQVAQVSQQPQSVKPASNWRDLDDRTFIQAIKDISDPEGGFYTTPEDSYYVNQRISEIKTAHPEWWKPVPSNPGLGGMTIDVNAERPVVQVIPLNPMELQNPMSPPGMKTVVIKQPPKEPGQEMMEEALRLRELAARQQQELAEQQRLQNLQPKYHPRDVDELTASIRWLEDNRVNYEARKQGNTHSNFDVFGEADGYWEAQKKRA